MEIAFHGGAGMVTGSKHLITLDNGKKILLDCGLFQGMGTSTASMNSSLGFEAATLEAVLLSHAHIDHSGLLPLLVTQGFNGRIFCTEATRVLTEILLQDSAQIQAHAYPDQDNAPCFTMEDVTRTMELITTVAFDDWFEPLEDVRVLYTRTGHLAGAAAIFLDLPSTGGRTLVAFSGDVGRNRHPLWLPAAPFPQADYLILESTYGDRHHDVLLSNVDILLDYIKKTCIRDQGKLIIPAFSVGRTQELLYVLHQLHAEHRLPELSYFVDSPLGIAATRAIREQTGEYGETLQHILAQGEDPFDFPGLKYIQSTDDSIRLREDQQACVVIASSGTADAGRVRYHIQEVIGDPRHTILFSGYCSPQSFGGLLLSGKKVVHFGGGEYNVEARIAQLKGLSAHGDVDDLVRFASCQDPALVRGVFLVHGERHAQEYLASRLKAKGFYPVTIPQPHESVALNRYLTTASSSTAPSVAQQDHQAPYSKDIHAPSSFADAYP
jgi:metallo-beta-lactamase family protein